MTASKCPKCNGKGYYTRVDWLLAVFSLGMTALMDKSNRIKCGTCAGTGVVR